MAGCQPLIVKTYGVTDDCLRRNLNVLKWLADTRPDIVLFHALWVVSGPDQLRPSIEALRSSGIARIVILGRVPNWTGGLPNVIAAYYRRTGHLLPERTSLFVEQEDEPMRRFSDTLGVEYISARQVFCSQAGCLNRMEDDLMTADAFHLAPPGSRYLIDQIAPALLRDPPERHGGTRIRATRLASPHPICAGRSFASQRKSRRRDRAPGPSRRTADAIRLGGDLVAHSAEFGFDRSTKPT